jgi:hypothetical protein
MSLRVVITLHPLHDDEFTRMTVEGFTSQLTKLVISENRRARYCGPGRQ